MFSEFDDIYMKEALKQARVAYDHDEVPVGAVIVHEKKIIAKAHNQVEMLKDPTAHAEMIAITQASNSLGCKWLYDCYMYVTLEPCSMCAGALVLSRIKGLCFGTRDPKSGACGSIANIIDHRDLNHSILVCSGPLAEECSEIMVQFFKNKRK